MELELNMAGSITAEDRAFVETWEHISPQRWGIIRLDPRGDEKHEIINGRRNFKITTEERIITQDRIKNESNDPFLNGSFRPVIVPDSVSIESNPNALSDEDINKILASSELAWEQWLETIDSVATLRRMLEIADNSDLTVRRYRALEARLEDVRGKVRIDTNDSHLRAFLSDRPSLKDDKADKAEDEVARRRQGGGLSSNYR